MQCAMIHYYDFRPLAAPEPLAGTLAGDLGSCARRLSAQVYQLAVSWLRMPCSAPMLPELSRLTASTPRLKLMAPACNTVKP